MREGMGNSPSTVPTMVHDQAFRIYNLTNPSPKNREGSF
jgi:hypothetical protein